MTGKPNIVFFGTPEFAVGCLEQLIKDKHKVVAVVTAPDRARGRGQKEIPSAVKAFAVEIGLPVLQPTNMKSEDFQKELKSYRPDLGIVVAFRMMPERVWSMPVHGTINLHASLLPHYRGAAPINWAIINGETKTGVTTFFLKHEIDTGDLIAQKEVNIGPDMTAGELHDELMRVGAVLLSESAKQIETGEVQTMPQEEMISDHCSLKLAPKIHKEDGRIDWNRKAAEIHNQIRGFSPYPAAWGIFERKDGGSLSFKVLRSVKTDETSTGKAGQIESDGKTYLKIGTEDYYIGITEIQLEGKKRMKVEDFLKGFPIQDVVLKPDR